MRKAKPTLAVLAAAILFSSLTAVTAGTAVALTAPGAQAAPASRPAPLVVRTDKGAIRGFDSAGAREFLGIPYAAPPVGSLRWRPPQPAAPWPGIRNATKPGNVCAQTGSIETGVPNTSTAEDCLYLNVYTPRAAPSTGPRRLPVMVWIHGGGFTGGAGSIYDGSVVAPKGNVIVVTINYRLGPFGFLALPSLDNESPDHSSGNYGLMDQQAALRWVQRNAAAFGGDPRNVTIFGESAGGASVCANMASPTAAGLFERAIAESGCLLPTPTLSQGEQQGASFAASLGCTDPATAATCLRGKPVTDLLNAAGGAGGWAAVTGGPILPQAPGTAFADGRYWHVPLLQGTNHDEGRFFVAFSFDALGHPLTAAQYPQLLAASYGANAGQVLAHYPLSAYASPDLAFASVLTDSGLACPALQADELAASRSRVYGYEFSDPNPPNDFGLTFSFPLGAAHSTELQYVFQRIPVLDTVPPFSSSQLALSDQMIGYWTRFAATGNPNAGSGLTGPGGGAPGPGAPYWPRFTAQRAQIQELVPGATHPSTSFATDHQCAFWSQLGAS